MEALFPSLEAVAVFEAADSLECIVLFAGGDRAKLRVLVCKKTTIISMEKSGIFTITEGQLISKCLFGVSNSPKY